MRGNRRLTIAIYLLLIGNVLVVAITPALSFTACFLFLGAILILLKLASWRAVKANIRQPPPLIALPEKASSPAGVILDYAAPEKPNRPMPTFLDYLYLTLTIACYMLALYANGVMSGGYSWSFDWEFASFLMTLAAMSSTLLFAATIGQITINGQQRVSIILLIASFMAGALPILMFFAAERWLQNNFA